MIRTNLADSPVAFRFQQNRPVLALTAAVCLLAGRLCAGGFLPVHDPRLPGMVFVPEGDFLMGSTNDQIDEIVASYGGSRSIYESEFPQHKVHLESFYIDRTEVTQADYKAFADATGREAPFMDREWAAVYNWSKGSYPKGLATHPVVLVSYFDAEAYCRWADKSLPTEAEWEKAARGADGRRYPWGNDWDKNRLNSSTSWSDHELPSIGVQKDWWSDVYKQKLRGKIVTTKPVGSYASGASPYGALDMAGNVFEWVAAWFEPYPASTYQNPEFGEKYRIVRGGDWYLDRTYTRAAARLRGPPEHKVPTIGFRCVCRSAAAARTPQAKK